MAKDVDLSSKEWRDLVFEGKNKEFGAYELRRKSNSRHNKAMIVVVIFILIVLGLTFVIGKIREANAEILAEGGQEEVAFVEAEETPEEEPEEEAYVEPEPEPEPEVIPEEVLNTMQVTEIAIVNDDQVENEVKTQEEIQQSETAIGTTDFDQGTDDINVVREHKDEIVVEEKKPEPVADNHVFQSVEQMPQFPGGDEALLKWLAAHVKYPPIAAENGVQGRVTVQFVVKKDGSVGDAKVVRGKDPDLDREAVRVVKSLPKFTPGRQNGQAVNVYYTVPINFRLQ